MTDLYLLVCGGRDYNDPDRVRTVLNRFATSTRRMNGRLHIVHGDARGADRLARNWVNSNPSVLQHPFPAQWNLYGRSAGPKRNQVMLDFLLARRRDENLVQGVAFPGGRGTADMVQRLRRARIDVLDLGEADE